jgi:hypothetical protein
MLTRWRLSGLLVGWAAYWVTIAAVKMGPALRAIRDARRGEGGTVQIEGGDGGLVTTVTKHGIETYSGTMTLFDIVVWGALPPLLLWAAWMWANARARRPAPEMPLVSEGEVDLRRRDPETERAAERRRG